MIYAYKGSLSTRILLERATNLIKTKLRIYRGENKINIFNKSQLSKISKAELEIEKIEKEKLVDNLNYERINLKKQIMNLNSHVKFKQRKSNVRFGTNKRPKILIESKIKQDSFTNEIFKDIYDIENMSLM